MRVVVHLDGTNPGYKKKWFTKKCAENGFFFSRGPGGIPRNQHWRLPQSLSFVSMMSLCYKQLMEAKNRLRTRLHCWFLGIPPGPREKKNPFSAHFFVNEFFWHSLEWFLEHHPKQHSGRAKWCNQRRHAIPNTWTVTLVTKIVGWDASERGEWLLSHPSERVPAAPEITETKKNHKPAFLTTHTNEGKLLGFHFPHPQLSIPFCTPVSLFHYNNYYYTT